MSAGSSAVDVIQGSYMRDGDVVPWWRFYRDQYVAARLAASPAPDLVVAHNERLRDFVADPSALDAVPHAFFPPALSAGTGATFVDALMTGGRTFQVSERGALALGLPPHVHLDLTALGWGSGLLEARLEVKGAGTLTDRTRLSPARLEALLAENPPLRATYRAWSVDGYPPQLMMSTSNFAKRELGAQSERYGRQAVEASRVQLGTSRVKFVPAWLAVAQPPAVRANVAFVSRALHEDAFPYDHRPTCELRFSPSTVRAAYFDTVDGDDDLVGLCDRVARQESELEETLHEMTGDAARYLEGLALSTMPLGDGFAWIKIGDVNEIFEPDEDGRYSNAEEFRRRRVAWLFAKDEVVVRRAGKFFTDMESYFGKDVGYASKPHELSLHHELYTLAALRDNIRVCTRFALGCALSRGRPVSAARRRAIMAGVVARIMAGVRAVPLLHVELTENTCVVELRYAQLGRTARFVLPREELAEFRF